MRPFFHTLWILCLIVPFHTPADPAVVEADVVVFGGTSGGIAAAVQARRMGKSVAIAEWTQHLGGLTTGGLGATDIGNKAAIGGIAREFYEQIAVHYAQPKSWKWEEPQSSAALGSGQERRPDPLAAKTGKPTKWTFEPQVAMAIYRRWLNEAGIPVRLGQRLVEVRKEGVRLIEFTTEDGSVYRGKVFIDASYEGDLMARAGVSHHVGREANATYGETLNGVRAQTPHHQFLVDVDPYLQPGDPASGLLPFIQSGDGGEPGQGDRSVQAYNFRLCMTRTRANQIPWQTIKPQGYDARNYELLARLIERHEREGSPLTVGQLMNPVMMPNDKTDTNNNGPFSTDFIGANHDYPDADYATRERIWKQHEDYIKGFLYFLATSTRVPERLRNEMQEWGLAADEFIEHGGFPTQLYVREARRMISDYVMTEANCRWQRRAEDSVGLGAYNMDSHNCQRVVQDGVVRNEGDVQVGVAGPYPISYRSLVPRPSEAGNLLVPVALAASHIAYGSIRMEPVFMALGQSAATAAALAIDGRIPVQQVDYTQLKPRLLADGQILEWNEPGRAAAANIDPATLSGVVMDDPQARFEGDWTHSAAVPSLGVGYRHDGNTGKGLKSARFQPVVPASGVYEIFLLYPANSNRASNVPVTVSVQGQEPNTVIVNQKQARADSASSLGNYTLPAGKTLSVTLSNAGTDGYVIADGLQLMPVR